MEALATIPDTFASKSREKASGNNLLPKRTVFVNPVFYVAPAGYLKHFFKCTFHNFPDELIIVAFSCAAGDVGSVVGALGHVRWDSALILYSAALCHP